MSLTQRILLPLIVALTQCVGPALIEAMHVHALPGDPRAMRQLVRHDGTSTTQPSIEDSERHCVLCQQLLQFVTTAAPTRPAPAVRRIAPAPRVHDESSVRFSLSSFSQRGPPALV
jgi:hypothetical protein